MNRRSEHPIQNRQRRNLKNSANVCRGEASISIAMAAEVVETKSLDWWMDGGWIHMIQWFIKYHRFEHPFPVRIGNGKIIYAYGKGCINILSFIGGAWKEKFLQDVLYVPDIHLNLFSVITTLDKGLKLEADSPQCQFFHLGERVGTAVRDKGLFRMMFKTVKSQVVNSVAQAANVKKKEFNFTRCHIQRRRSKY